MKLANNGGQPEIFFSIQGEGHSAGYPAVFVRAARCNLVCYWCDTEYTWHWRDGATQHQRDQQAGYIPMRKAEAIIEIEPDEIAALVTAYPCRRVIFTGGEPLLQQNAFAALAQALKAVDSEYLIEIETNGTIVPATALDQWVSQYNVSPKLSGSGNVLASRLKQDALAFFASEERAYFKFVIAGDSDLQELESLIKDYDLDKSRVLLMPEGCNATQLNKTADALFAYCRDNGLRYSDRLHIRLYGDRRGV